MRYTDASHTLIDAGDGRFIPVDPRNADYAALADVAIEPYVAPPVPRTMSPLQFVERFTDAEQLALAGAAIASAPIKLWYDKLLAASFVDLDDPRLAAGVQVMVQSSLLTAPRALQVLGQD